MIDAAPAQADLSETTLSQLTTLFSAIADPTRARIVLLVQAEERRSGDIAEALGMTPSAVSHQLRWLRDQNIISARRAGREVYYRLADACIDNLLAIALGHIQEQNATAQTQTVSASNNGS